MTTLETEITRYRHLNSIAEDGSAVFFGDDCFANLPVSELRQDYCLDMPVYNRSIHGLQVADAEQFLNECVYPLNPAKVFINLGASDLEGDHFDLKAFLSAYEWLLYSLHSHCRCRIYVVSVISEHPLAGDVNTELRRMAADAGCDYIDITPTNACVDSEIRIFDRFRCFLHRHPMGFTEAFLV